MKILLVLLITVLLSGCEHGGLTKVSDLTVPTQADTLRVGMNLYDSGSTVERQTLGAVKSYPLPLADAYSIRSFGSDLLVFSGEQETTLTVLSCPGLQLHATVTLEEHLAAEDPSLQIGEEQLSFFSESSRETLVLAKDLTLVRRIPAPETLSGKPLLSEYRNTLYYCTENAILAWDLQEDLHWILRAQNYDFQTVRGLHQDGNVLECLVRSSGQEELLFLSTEAGQLLHTFENTLNLQTCDGRYYADYPNGAVQTVVFGTDPLEPQALIPQEPDAKCTFLPVSHGALTVSTPAEGQLYISCYDFSTGRLFGSLSLPECQYPLSIADGGQFTVYLLVSQPDKDGQAVYRWDPGCQPSADLRSFTGPHFTLLNPDLEGLALCQSQADSIAGKYGISIQLWEDAIRVQPWDYTLEPEYRVDILKQELSALEQRLSQYPPQLIRDTASHFSSLSICLVRKAVGTQPETALTEATGVHFVDGTDAYLILTCGEFSERTLYHELFHVMETHMWGNCSAFDRWDELNPAGFRYDYSYISNSIRDAGVYLHTDNRAFVDTYSMSFPREDRARILEYAMLPGNEDVFRSQIMQRKLQTLCQGIRQAYRLQDWQEPLLWEQYLK